MKSTRRGLVALGAGAIPSMTAGCLRVVDGGEATTAADLRARLADLERPDSMIATVETTIERGGTTGVTTDEITARITGETYVEGRSDDAVFRNVDDGERGWFHDLERNRVAVVDSDGTGESHIDYVYDRTTTYFDRLEARLAETTTLDGRAVYRLSFEPPPAETVERSIGVLVGTTEFVIPLETEEREESEFRRTVDRIDVWFDRETLFPVRQVVETSETDFEAVHASLSLNEPVDDDLFAYEPPADALVEEHVFPYLERYDSLSDAKAAAGVSMAEPNRVPERFDAAAAAVVDYPFADDRREVSIRYAGDESVGESIRVGACNGSRPFDLGGEAVAVDGADGTIVESDLGTTLEWPCDDLTHFVFATEPVARETVLSVAKSVDGSCG